MDSTEQELIKELADLMVEQDKLREGENPKKQLEQKVSENLFGGGTPSRRPRMKWGSLFRNEECPIDSIKMARKEDKLMCSQCNLSIPAELFEKAKQQHMKEYELLEREEKMREKMSELKLDDKNIDGIYGKALEKAESEKEVEKPDEK
jgi:hypothetical protein